MKPSPSSILVVLVGSSVLMSEGAAAPASFLVIGDQVYVEHTKIKCFVEKAVPAPQAGRTWYTQSPIGQVWLVAEPTGTRNTFLNNRSTVGRVRLYRTDGMYQELMSYPNAWWAMYDEKIQGLGDASVELKGTETNPLFFSINRIEGQGLMNGKDGKPAYFLSECSFTTELMPLKENERVLALALQEAESRNKRNQ
jgi:hypothetical protein